MLSFINIIAWPIKLAFASVNDNKNDRAPNDGVKSSSGLIFSSHKTTFVLVDATSRLTRLVIPPRTCHLPSPCRIEPI